MRRLLSAILVTLLFASPLTALATGSLAASLDRRVEAVGQAVEAADEMYTNAKKGHLPSLEAINALHARLALARRLYEEAKRAAGNGKTYEAGARLDAAEFLARAVYEASKH